MMSLDRGPGVIAWEQQHQATPLSSETYLPPNFDRSVTLEQVADSTGKPVGVAVVWDKATGTLTALTNPNFPISLPPTASPAPAGMQKGFDIAYPQGQNLLGVIQALGATFVACYIGGADYIGTWTAPLALSLQPSLSGGFCPIYVPHQATIAAGDVTQAENDAQEANGILSSWAFTQAGNLFVDVEANTWFANPAGCQRYLNAFFAMFTDLQPQDPPLSLTQGWDPGIYGPRGACDVYKANPACATWLANWDGVAEVEGYDMHQYSGATSVDGVQVDLNVTLLRAPAYEFAHY